MNYPLKNIYHKTEGYCHLCYKKLSWSNYGKHGRKGAWQVEHSKPKAKGGTNHLNNLFPACITCNLAKGVSNTRLVRERNGFSRAPYSKAHKQKIKRENAQGGAVIGFAIGAAIAGPLAAGIFSFIGAEIGKNISPNK